MPNPFNSISLATYRANGDLIDRQEYDGTLNAVKTIAEDASRFQDIWEINESYRICVNGIEVTTIYNFRD